MKEQPIYVAGWMPKWVLEAFRSTCWLSVHGLAHVEVRGVENMATSGGAIVALSHSTYFDAPLAFTLMKGRRPTVFSADKYRHHWFFRPILEGGNCIWVNREAPAPATIKVAVRALREGALLGMAPEGRRSRTGQLLPGKTGVAYLAITAGVPVIPLALAHLNQIIPHLKRLRRARVVATVCPPLTFTPANPNGRATQAEIETFTTEIMCQLAAHLPEEQRGAYAGHPRVMELLGASSGAQTGR
jgi:1-acyl-sn-glycerol-3-phosphate acyltransferase